MAAIINAFKRFPYLNILHVKFEYLKECLTSKMCWNCVIKVRNIKDFKYAGLNWNMCGKTLLVHYVLAEKQNYFVINYEGSNEVYICMKITRD